MANVQFYKVHFKISNALNGCSVNLPLVRTNREGLFNLAGVGSYDWSKLVLTIGNVKIPITADPSTARKMALEMLTGNPNVKTVNLDSSRLSEIYTMTQAELITLTNSRVVWELPRITYPNRTAITDQISLLSIKCKEINLNIGTTNAPMWVSGKCQSKWNIPPRIEKHGSNHLLISGYCEFDQNPIMDRHKIRVVNDGIAITSPDGLNEATWTDNYVAIATPNLQVTNLWLMDAPSCGVPGYQPSLFEGNFVDELMKIYGV